MTETTMQAGRELDAMVAEKVMGETVPRFLNDGKIVPMLYGGSDLPHYSTDIAAAWLVVERLGEAGYSVDMEWKGAGRGYAFTAEVVVTKDIEMQGHAVADTMPHAICLAALAGRGAGGAR